MEIEKLQKLAKLIRFHILTMTTRAASGHATSSLSAVELMTALFFREFRADLDNPGDPANDRLIFSKGHASPLFYALYAAAGKLTPKDLEGYRKFTSNLEGHPTLEFPYTEAPTGSLGQGLPIGLGMAMALRAKLKTQNLKLKTKVKNPQPITHNPQPNVFVLLGDGEMAEGSVWEAIQAASYHKVDNLAAILDVNRLGQSQSTMMGHDLGAYKRRIEAFGWQTVVVEKGNDMDEVSRSYREVVSLLGRGKPVFLIAKTFKGAGVKLLSDKDNWHGKPLPPDLYKQALEDLGKVDTGVRGEVKKPEFRIPASPVGGQNSELKIKKPATRNPQPATYRIGDPIATRQAAGDALTNLMYKYPQAVALDGDVKNSLYTESTQKAHPDRYFEFFIAEQNMTGAAIGFSRRGFIPFVTTFSAFMTRAYDQVRMASLARADIKFIGSHAGVSIGEDGASQMGLEDLSMFRSVFGSTVLYPADAVSSGKLVEEMIKTPGICYLRAGRPATPVIYSDKEKFPVGGCKIHFPTHNPQPKTHNKVIIISAGVTLYEALKAQTELAKEGIEVTVVDCYSIKPIDEKTLKSLVKPATRNPQPITVITVEDHWSEGGLGDAVLNVFSYNLKPITYNLNIHKLSVTREPHSGKPAELLSYEGIDAAAIVKKVKSLL